VVAIEQPQRLELGLAVTVATDSTLQLAQFHLAELAQLELQLMAQAAVELVLLVMEILV
jgi:hypothetical protein